ncbi:hypothetical protein [Bifidobacterium lemurum]|uniref:hypothetical protein n=1 Tax=Bifidobacterium lemurum TaxID=1603886 RepID=UPI00186665E4|nr:hypothetical protein [Bifidobacterium lemurum]QOL34377.1 hypothetical protein BL8807_00010 [Bifidobacterium lemurum]
MNVNASNNPLRPYAITDMLLRMFADALALRPARRARGSGGVRAPAAMLRREMGWTRALPDDVFGIMAWPRVNNERSSPAANGSGRSCAGASKA